MFTFLSPLFLIGLLAAAIPLVVHLSRSRRQKKMRFSTTRFFTDQFLRSYRMSKLKEIWLLIARMALFALFALALAQPILMPKGGRAWLTGKRSLVIVLDNSASMGYVADGVSLFDRARAAAKELLDGLRPGDTASIVLAARRSGVSEVLFPEPSTALGDVRRALDALKVSDLGTDLSAAVKRAEQVARSGSANSREVYVLSDLQDSGWEIREEAADRPTESEVLFFFVSIRPKSPQNLSITAVQYAAARPMAGIPFAIRPHVLNQGSDVRAAEATLFVDGQKVGQQALDKLQPGRWATPMFHHTFTCGGWHTGYVEVQDENFTADNRRWFAFEVMDAIKVLTVNGAPSQVAQLDELFFLRTALTVSPEGKGAIQMDVASPAELATRDFKDYPLLILANVESLPPAAVEKLEEFTDRGGSLLVFLGDKTSAAFYNQYLAAPTRLHGGLLPAKLGKIVGQPGGEQPYAFVAGVDPENPALAAFTDPKFASLSGVNFKALWDVEPHDALVLMRANTGEALLLEKSFGKGRVLLFTSSCDRDWGNFPVRPAFLPWIHRLVAHLAQDPLGRAPFYTTGQRVPLPVSATEGVEQILVKKPDGAIGHATTSDDPRVPLEFADTTQLGVYTLSGTNQVAQVFVANLEGYESDLTYLDDVLAARGNVERGLKQLLPGRALVNYVESPARLAEASLGARRGLKLWDIFLVVVLLIALFEPWLANRISLRHYAQPASGKSGGSDIPVAIGRGRNAPPTRTLETADVG